MEKRYVGAIAFLDSEKEPRNTNPMSFMDMAEWLTSAVNYYRAQVKFGYYDGTEVLIGVYEEELLYQESLDSVSIKNPHYI